LSGVEEFRAFTKKNNDDWWISFNREWSDFDEEEIPLVFLDIHYSSHICLSEFRNLSDLRLRFSCLQYQEVMNDISVLSTVKKIVVFDSCEQMNHTSMSKIIQFIISLHSCVQDFAYHTQLNSHSDDLTTHNQQLEDETEIFANFMEHVICEMHWKFELKLSKCAFNVFLKLGWKNPVIEFCGVAFLNGQLYVNFLRGLLKVQDSPFLLIETSLDEMKTFYSECGVNSSLTIP